MLRADDVELLQERHNVPGATGIDAFTLRDRVQMVKHVEQQRGRLVYRADDRAAFAGQLLQQCDTLRGRGAVQAARRLVEEHYRRIVHDFQRDR